MGEMADMAIDVCIDQWAEEAANIDDLLRRLNNQELFEFTAGARLPLVVGIRQHYVRHDWLSPKQRYCLARWIVEHDRPLE